MITYKEVKGMNEETYMLHMSPEAELNADLSAPARQLYNLMKEMKPEQFQELMSKESLIPLLNKIADEHIDRMMEHIQSGWTEIEASEAEWWTLTVEAGLENSPKRILPQFPPR